MWLIDACFRRKVFRAAGRKADGMSGPDLVRPLLKAGLGKDD
jgi:hypothetical protein